MTWNIEKARNIKGKIILVTGGNSGLGYESVKTFASLGAHVIMASRSIERGELSKTNILEEYPLASIEVMQLDLASIENIKAFVELFKKKYNQLDILLNNAGIMTTPYGLTTDGLEQQTGVNHFGHFLLTALLFDTIKSTNNSRVVNVSSLAHKNGQIDFKNLFYEKKNSYSKIKAYSRSKLENLLFTYELHSRIEKAQLNIKVLVAHPGVSKTNLGRHIKGGILSKAIKLFQRFFAQEAHQGIQPQIRAALDENAKSGEFYGPDGLFQTKGSPIIVKSSKKSHNSALRKQLWQESEKLMNVKFKI